MLLQLTHLFGETPADGMIELAWTDPQIIMRSRKPGFFDIADFLVRFLILPPRVMLRAAIFISARPYAKRLPDHKRTSDNAFISLTAAYVDLDKPGVASQSPRDLWSGRPDTGGDHRAASSFRAQLWWRLDEPEADPDKSRSLNKHLAVALSGDETVVNPSASCGWVVLLHGRSSQGACGSDGSPALGTA